MAILKVIALTLAGVAIFIWIPAFVLISIKRVMRARSRPIQWILAWANAFSLIVLVLYAVLAFMRDFERLRSQEPEIFYILIGSGLFSATYSLAHLSIGPAATRIEK